MNRCGKFKISQQLHHVILTACWCWLLICIFRCVKLNDQLLFWFNSSKTCVLWTILWLRVYSWNIKLMNAKVKNFISKCSICQSHKPDQCREDMQPYPVPPRPWSMLAADLFELGQQQFFLLVQEVQEVKVVMSASVIAACKVQFSWPGIPEVLITHNGLTQLKPTLRNYKAFKILQQE